MASSARRAGPTASRRPQPPPQLQALPAVEAAVESALQPGRAPRGGRRAPRALLPPKAQRFGGVVLGVQALGFGLLGCQAFGFFLLR